MAKLTKSERDSFLNNLYIYEAALNILKAQISIVNIEYGQLIRQEGYNEIQNEKYRIKTIDSIAGKLEKCNVEFTMENIEEHVHDIVGARIVCLTLRDVECIKNLILNNKNFKVVKVKDYIAEPKKSGYQSLHIRNLIDVNFTTGSYQIPTEIQIRTSAMDAWASLEHKIGYKPEDLMIAEMLKGQLETFATVCNSTDNVVSLALSKGKK